MALGALAAGGLGGALGTLVGVGPLWLWAVLAGAAGAVWAARGGQPWALAWGYLALSPWPDGRLALLAVALMLVGQVALVTRRARLSSAWPGVVLAVGALVLYGATVAPGVLPADSGEFQLVAATLGIAHPPGYPLYTLVGWLFTRLTATSPAWGLNLLSAFLATGTLVMVYVAALRVGGHVSPRPSSIPLPPSSPHAWGRKGERRAVTRGKVGDVIVLAAPLALMGATTFWAAATTANIRILVALFAAAILLAALSAVDRPTPRRLALLVLVTALGVGHHGSLAFTALPAFLAVAWRWLDRRESPKLNKTRQDVARASAAISYWPVVVAALVGLLPLLYLPLRGAPGVPPHPDALATLGAWLDHALARGFGGDMFAFARPALLPDRLRILMGILRFQFGWPLLAMAALGVVGLLARVRRPHGGPIALLLIVGFALPAFVAITYRAPQTVEYLMPAYVALALLVGAGVASGGAALRRLGGDGDNAAGVAEKRLQRRLVATLGVTVLSIVWLPLVVGLGLWNVLLLWPSYAALSRDTGTEDGARAMLAQTPPNAPIFAGWHQATPLWYLQVVAGLRPDVTTTYVAPAGAEEYPQTWRRTLDGATQAGPAVATNRYGTYGGAPFNLAPLAEGFLALRGEPPVPPDAMPIDVTVADGLRLEAARGLAPLVVEPDRAVVIDLYWRFERPAPAATSFYVHLLDAGGQVVGQADVSRPLEELGAGRRVVTRHVLPVLPTTPPGPYRLVAGAYRTGPGGLTELSPAPTPLGEIQVSGETALPMLANLTRAAVSDAVTLVGWSVDTTQAVPRLTLAWRREGAGVADIRVEQAGATVAPLSVPAAPVGQYVLTAVDLPTLAPVTLRGERSAMLLVGPTDTRWLDYGGEAALVGVTAQRDGRDLVVDLTWLALRPLTHDYSVTVKARGAGWTAQNDGTPAGGAAPTLKWVAGMRVEDRRRLRLPADANGPIDITVGLYDAFTATPLGVNDERLLKLGQGDVPTVLTVR